MLCGWEDGPDFTYVIDRTGGGIEPLANGTGAPQAPIQLRRGISPSAKKAKEAKKTNTPPAANIRMIDFDRDTPTTVKKKEPTNCYRHM